MNPLLLSSICAFITAGTLLYAGRVARIHGRKPLSLFRLICAAWFVRYAFSLAASSLEGKNALSWASDHRVIFISNASMAVAAMLTLSEWRDE